MRKTLSLLTVPTALVALATGGVVRAEGNSGFYIGGGLGTAVVDINDLEFSERDTAFKVLAGYAISDFIAVEAAYFDGGDPKEEFGANAIMVSTSGYNASLVLRARTGSQIVVFGKVGYAQYDFAVTQLVDSQPVSTVEETDGDLTLGLGVTYNFRERFIFRAEYERAEVSDFDFQLLSFVAGIQF